MGGRRALRVVLGVTLPFLFVGLFLFVMCCCRGRSFKARGGRRREVKGGVNEDWDEEEEREEEDLVVFPGGEELTVQGILDAPGEVVGKSSYSTLYKACLQVGGSGGSRTVLMLLRFVRPACTGSTNEIFPAVQLLGLVRHPNLVPIWAMYVGPRGEKLLVHPFFKDGSLFQFLRDGNSNSYKWEVIYKLSLGIAKGIDHLHNALQRPVIFGNLKSTNILLDEEFRPHLSDYGLHLLLNPTAAQEMLELSALHGYKAPELIKLRDASKKTDIYSLGVIFLEMLTRKEPKSTNLSSSWELHLPTSLRNMALGRKLPNIFNSGLLSQDKDQKSYTEEQLLAYFQLAMACCSPSPSLRPDIKVVLRRLEEIGRKMFVGDGRTNGSDV